MKKILKINICLTIFFNFWVTLSQQETFIGIDNIHIATAQDFINKRIIKYIIYHTIHQLKKTTALPNNQKKKVYA